jgi:hypothetical protein
MTLDLPDEDIEFVLQTLQTQPLPFTRTAPIIGRIVKQIAARQEPVDVASWRPDGSRIDAPQAAQ